MFSNPYALIAYLRGLGYAPELRHYGDGCYAVIAWYGIESYTLADDDTPNVAFCVDSECRFWDGRRATVSYIGAALTDLICAEP